MTRFCLLTLFVAIGAAAVYTLTFGTTTTTYAGPDMETTVTYSLGGFPVPGILIAGGSLLLLAALAVLSWLGVRGSSATAGRALIGTSVLAHLIGFFVCIYALNIAGIVILFGALALLVPSTLGFGVGWAVQQDRRALALIGVLLVSLLPASMLLHPWPLHAAFVASNGSLQKLVDEVRSGEMPTLPCRAGVFRIKAIDTEGETVALIVDNNSAGRSALVSFKPLRSGDSYSHYGPMYNLNWDHELAADWRYQNED